MKIKRKKIHTASFKRYEKVIGVVIPVEPVSSREVPYLELQAERMLKLCRDIL